MTSYIIEGCDCTGKTTLIKEFLKHDKYKKFKVIHCSAPPKDLSRGKQYQFCKKQYEKIVREMNKGSDLLLDRFHLGEAVYAPIFRGYFPDYIRDLEKTMKNVKLVVLSAHSSVVEDRFDGKFITKAQIPGILKGFESQFYLSEIKDKILINTSLLSPEEVYRKAVFKDGNS